MGTRARGAKGEGVDYKRFLLSRLQKGAQRVRGADVSTGVALILSIWVCYLLVAVMLDQLLVLPPMMRLVLLIASGSASVVIAYWWIVRPLTSSVNSLYTARTLESAKPDIKNSFVNWTELSKKQDEIPDVIMKTIESRAAQEISKVKVEDAIQPRLVLPALYTMSAVVILFCLFTRFTSKDLFSSFQRVLLPLAELRPPTSTELRITFDPGEKTGTEPAPLPAGGAMTVKAMLVRGKPDSITAYVRAEGTDYDEPHNLSPTGATNEFVLTLPKRQKTFDLMVLAGDYRSRSFRVVVTAAPMITDWLLTYTPPAYTGEAPFTSTQPDIDGLEGTKVRIEATSNLPVKPTGAMMELMDRTIDMGLVEGSEVKLAGEMTLTKDGTYRVKFQDSQSRSPEFRPIHHIRVRVDQPPRMEFVSPAMPEIDWPADQPLTIHGKVTDDFGIRRSRLVIAKSDDGDEVLDLEKGGPGEALGRSVVWKETLTPTEMKGKPGDIFEYWMEATDSKLPLSNDASTRADRRRIKLVAPPERKENESANPPDNKEKPTEIAKNDSPKDAEEPAQSESTTSDGSPDESAMAQNSAKKNPSDESKGSESASSGDDQTPTSNPKDEAAMERLQKYFEKNREGSSSAGNQEDGKEGDNSSPDQAADQRENASAGEQSGEQNQGEQGSQGERTKGASEASSKNEKKNSQASEQESSTPQNQGESDDDQNKQGNSSSQSQAGDQSTKQDSSAGQQQSGSPQEGSEGKQNQPPDGTPSNDGESSSQPPSSSGSNSAGQQQGQSSESKPSSDGKESAGQQGAGSEKGEAGDKGASSPGSSSEKESAQQGEGPPKPDGTGSKNANRSSKQGNDNASASQQGNTDGSASQAESGSPDPKGDGERAAGQDGKPDSVSQRPTSDGSGEPSQSSSGEPSESSGEGSKSSKEGEQATGGEQGSKQGSSGGKEGSAESSSSSSPQNGSSQGKESTDGQSENADKPASGGKGSSNSADGPSQPGSADPKNAGKSSSKEGGDIQQGGQPSDQAGSANEPIGPTEVNDNLGEKANPADKENGSNLILRRLEEELRQKKVDPELLKEMGWTEEDAKKFAERMRAESAKEVDKSDPLNQAKRAGFGQGTDLRKSTGRSAGKGADQLQDLFSGGELHPLPRFGNDTKRT